MKPRNPADNTSIQKNRSIFLKSHDIDANNATLLRLEYDGNDYCRYVTLNDSQRGDGLIRQSTFDVDGMVVTKPHHAILLPLADCIGAVLYDPKTKTLMVSHLGRHNLEQFGGTESVKYVMKNHNVDVNDLHVWLSPAASKHNYPLHAFDNRGLHEVAVEQLRTAGVPEQNIDVSSIDTTTNMDYFSHSEFLKGNRPTDGRFCIVAEMR